MGFVGGYHFPTPALATEFAGRKKGKPSLFFVFPSEGGGKPDVAKKIYFMH